MSVEQRRTEVLRRQDLDAGSVRLTKASSRYDRRLRFYAVEFLPPAALGTDLEDWRWTVLCDWPISCGEHMPKTFYRGALQAVQEIGRLRTACCPRARLAELEHADSTSGLQRKVARQARVIRRLEDRLRDLGTKPHESVTPSEASPVAQVVREFRELSEWGRNR